MAVFFNPYLNQIIKKNIISIKLCANTRQLRNLDVEVTMHLQTDHFVEIL